MLEARILEALASLDAGHSCGMTGYAIAKRIEYLHPPAPIFFGRWGPRWGGVVSYGSLYPTLRRLVMRGQLELARCTDVDGHRYYRLPYANECSNLRTVIK